MWSGKIRVYGKAVVKETQDEAKHKCSFHLEGGGSDGEGGLERFSRGVIGDKDRVKSKDRKEFEVVKYEVLIEKEEDVLSWLEEILVEEDEDDKKNKKSS
ncbi:hypothetical protein Tco_0026327 [Tanacetum coccineum]